MNFKIIAIGVLCLAVGSIGTALLLKMDGAGSSPISPQTGSDVRQILYWTDPMLPGFRSATPGKSPMGMDMVAVYADAAGGGGTTVTVPEGVMQSLGVRTAAVQRRDLVDTLSVPGVVAIAPNAVRRIQVRAAGWVEHLAPLTAGTRVRTGERLFDLYAPDILAAKAEYASVLRMGDKRVANPAENRLRLLGVPEDEIAELKSGKPATRATTVSAPFDGIVDDIVVTENSYVTSDSAVMTILDPSNFWAMLDIPQNRAAEVMPGLVVAVRAAGFGRQYEGDIVALDPRTKEITRAVTARVKLQDPGLEVRIGAAIEGRITLPARSNVLVVPPEAVIRTGRENRVVVVAGEGRFRSVAVMIGLETTDGIEIRDGLSESDMVVTSGQFLIDSDSNMRAASGRLDPGQGKASLP